MNNHDSEIATTEDALLKRLERFFAFSYDERNPLLSFIKSLNGLSEVLIFGGLIRDICLHGIKSFRSDVDIVVKIKDKDQFAKCFEKYKVIRNKFGGSRVFLSRWIVDIWEFENTWAFQQGLVDAKSNNALLDTTFFNWDACYYDYRSSKIFCHKHYFETISEKILDINLKPNPNEFGAFVRALRLIAREQAQTGRTLSDFIVSQFAKVSNRQILDFEVHHFTTLHLNSKIVDDLRWQSQGWNELDILEWVPDKQLEFELESN